VLRKRNEEAVKKQGGRARNVPKSGTGWCRKEAESLGPVRKNFNQYNARVSSQTPAVRRVYQPKTYTKTAYANTGNCGQILYYMQEAVAFLKLNPMR
jgi:hypothetical protein